MNERSEFSMLIIRILLIFYKRNFEEVKQYLLYSSYMFISFCDTEERFHSLKVLSQLCQKSLRKHKKHSRWFHKTNIIELFNHSFETRLLLKNVNSPNFDSTIGMCNTECLQHVRQKIVGHKNVKRE